MQGQVPAERAARIGDQLEAVDHLGIEYPTTVHQPFFPQAGGRVLRIVVMPFVALIAAAMVPASVNAITPTDGYNVAVYIIAAVAMFAILWRPAVWVVADGYPAIEWPRIPKPSLSYTKRRDNRYDLKADPEYQKRYQERMKEYGSK